MIVTVICAQDAGVLPDERAMVPVTLFSFHAFCHVAFGIKTALKRADRSAVTRVYLPRHSRLRREKNPCGGFWYLCSDSPLTAGLAWERSPSFRF